MTLFQLLDGTSFQLLILVYWALSIVAAMLCWLIMIGRGELRGILTYLLAVAVSVAPVARALDQLFSFAHNTAFLLVIVQLWSILGLAASYTAKKPAAQPEVP